MTIDLKTWGVPFAPTFGERWPVAPSSGANKTVSYTTADGAIVGNAATRFHASRENGKRWHAGLDLVASPGDPIVAVAAGKVLGQIPGFVRLGAVVVQHAAAVAVYAEIALDSLAASGLKPGDAVESGQRIGTGALNYEGHSMLHFELWELGHAPAAYTPWMQGSPPPAGLLDPTAFALELAGASTSTSTPAPSDTSSSSSQDDDGGGGGGFLLAAVGVVFGGWGLARLLGARR